MDYSVAMTEPLTGVLEYQGNINYCYADATAMFVSAHGGQGIGSGLIEVLTGISLMGGHRLSEPECEKIYFSTVPTPTRLSTALDLLGFACETESGPADADPVAILRSELETGPLLLGPLDMGYLKYFPFHQHAHGADHYIVAYAIDGERLRLHDPLGFPAATLGFEDLAESWRAEALPCPGGPFHRWRALRRVADPTPQEIFSRAVEYFETVRQEVPSGSEVIRQYAKELRAEQLGPRSLAFLTIFSFPVQSRRGLDYARFFKAGGDLVAARHKLRQSELFGECLQLGNAGEWSRVADHFMELADIEDQVSQHRFA